MGIYVCAFTLCSCSYIYFLLALWFKLVVKFELVVKFGVGQGYQFSYSYKLNKTRASAKKNFKVDNIVE